MDSSIDHSFELQPPPTITINKYISQLFFRDQNTEKNVCMDGCWYIHDFMTIVIFTYIR